jgi:hypothetical protein
MRFLAYWVLLVSLINNFTSLNSIIGFLAAVHNDDALSLNQNAITNDRLLGIYLAYAA